MIPLKEDFKMLYPKLCCVWEVHDYYVSCPWLVDWVAVWWKVPSLSCITQSVRLCLVFLLLDSSKRTPKLQRNRGGLASGLHPYQVWTFKSLLFHLLCAWQNHCPRRRHVSQHVCMGTPQNCPFQPLSQIPVYKVNVFFLFFQFVLAFIYFLGIVDMLCMFIYSCIFLFGFCCKQYKPFLKCLALTGAHVNMF